MRLKTFISQNLSLEFKFHFLLSKRRTRMRKLLRESSGLPDLQMIPNLPLLLANIWRELGEGWG